MMIILGLSLLYRKLSLLEITIMYKFVIKFEKVKKLSHLTGKRPKINR